MALPRPYGDSSFSFKPPSQKRGKILRKSCVVGSNAITNDRPGPGGVVYIQQMLVNNNKWVITKTKVNPRLKTNKRTSAMKNVTRGRNPA